MSALEEIQAKRAARQETLAKQADEQKAIDFQALDDAEIKYGDGNITFVELPFVESGTVTLVIARTPKPAEIARFRARVKPKRGGDPVDATEASIELAAVCQVYPERERYDAIVEARPGITTLLAKLCVDLSAGEAKK